jgi:putative oxidoreductase
MKTAEIFKTYILSTTSDKRVIFIRLIVGLIFISEGIQKYLFLEILGPGRFHEIGFSHAFFWAYFTGACEMFFGFLVLIGLFTRLASIPLLIIMGTAFVTTKIPILVTQGLWSFLHEYRTDFSLTVLLTLLFISGGGKWSADLKILPQ